MTLSVETRGNTAIRQSCLVCDAKRLREIVDLGVHPFADTFVGQDRLEEREASYPLVVDLCLDCGNAQSRSITDPTDRYQAHDYSYTSSNSSFSRAHWESYAREIATKAELAQGASVIEIGSNDGFLSEQFKRQGSRVLGVDAAPYMANLAKYRGVETEVAIFGEKTVATILERFGKADLLVANNVLNHADDPRDFTHAVAAILKPNGVFVSEQPYWRTTIASGRFDQIYHEHVSYFSVKSLCALFQRSGLCILSTEEVNYHGGALRTYATLGGVAPLPESAERMIALEEAMGLFHPAIYARFVETLRAKRETILAELRRIRATGHRIVGVGAAAKANTFLTFFALDASVLDFVTDSSPHKQGKWTPGTRIPICGDEVFAQYDKVYALILSWNISENLEAALRKINPKICFLSPFA